MTTKQSADKISKAATEGKEDAGEGQVKHPRERAESQRPRSCKTNGPAPSNFVHASKRCKVVEQYGGALATVVPFSTAEGRIHPSGVCAWPVVQLCSAVACRGRHQHYRIQQVGGGRQVRPGMEAG